MEHAWTDGVRVVPVQSNVSPTNRDLFLLSAMKKTLLAKKPAQTHAALRIVTGDLIDSSSVDSLNQGHIAAMGLCLHRVLRPEPRVDHHGRNRPAPRSQPCPE